MAIEFVGSNTGTTTNGGNVAIDLTALTGGIDTRPRNGDIILAFGAVPSNTAGIDWSGYTVIDEDVNSASTGRGALYYKISDGTETTATFTGDGSGTSSVGALVMVFRGVDTADPFSATATTATGSSTNPAPAAITPDYPESASVVFAFSRVNDATITVPANYGNLVTVNAGADTNDVSLAAAWRGGRLAVAHTPGTFTGWSTGSWRAITVALKPITPRIEFVGRAFGTALNGGDVSLDLTTLTGGIAASPSQNDLVIVTGGFVGATAGVNTAGYTEIVDQTNTIEQIVAYKIMGATPDTTVDCAGGGDANDAVAYVAFVFRGVDTANPLAATTTLATGSSTTPDSPSITVGADTVVITAVASATFSSGLSTPLHWASNNAQNDDTSDATAGLAYQTQNAAATVDPPSWTGFVSGAWCAATVALRPLAVPVIGGGLHHIECGEGDPGVARVPQTLHTIDLGIAA